MHDGRRKGVTKRWTAALVVSLTFGCAGTLAACSSDEAQPDESMPVATDTGVGRPSDTADAVDTVNTDDTANVGDTAATTTDDPGGDGAPTWEQIRVTADGGSAIRSLSVSADGASLAFESDEGVGLIAVDTGGTSTVVDNGDLDGGAAATNPTYLDDGRLAVLISQPGETGGTINIVGDEGDLTPIDLPVTVIDIEGGADDTIVYVTYTDGERSIGKVQVDATSPTASSITVGSNDHDPAVSPDGTQLAFIRTDADDGGNEVNTLVVIDVAGGIEFPITSSPLGGVLRAPSWSPDGSRLAVSMTATGDDGVDVEQVFVIDPAVGTIQVTDTEGDKPETVWISNDKIAYRSASTGDPDGQIFLVAAPAAG